MWENANMYFLLTDRFKNGDPSNDNSFGRKEDGAPMRSFMGGDIRGVIQKLEEGYFRDLGINAIWMTPVFQQVKASVDEGFGHQYAFHGYWISDWTTLDPNFGTMEDLEELIQKAHAQEIRIASMWSSTIPGQSQIKTQNMKIAGYELLPGVPTAVMPQP